MSPLSFERRSQRLQRKRPFRDVRSRILIVCEGEVTEPSYFGFVRHERRHPLVAIHIDGAGAVPHTLVERAIAKKNEGDRAARRQRDPDLKFDQVWCVFDTDDHPNIDDARTLAVANGIELAISNPSFELWLLLHFQGQNGNLTRESARRLCKTHLHDYEKEIDERMYSRLSTLYPDAVARASGLITMHRNNGNDTHTNPSTGIFRLTELIAKTAKIT